MKFFLTIYICSVVTQNCAEVPVENHNYNRFYETHGECVQKGLGESYSILFDGKLFKIDTVNAMELYPKFMCEKTDNPKVPEESVSAS
jgi:predicted transcriptional regulator YdeE